MNNTKNNSIHYTILAADRALTDRIAEAFWTNPTVREKRYDYSTHAAILADGEIVGYLSTTDKTAANGAYSTRHIHFIRVNPEYRRKGIATALVAAMMGKAKADGVKYLSGMVASENEGAEKFWKSVGFCLIGGVRAKNGGLCHDILYGFGETGRKTSVVSCESVDASEGKSLFDAHMRERLGNYWRNRADVLYTVKATDADGRLLGVTVADALDIGSPYKGWGVAPYIYTADDAPVGTEESLVEEMARLAAENGVESLCTLYKYSEYGMKWLELGFVPTMPGLLKSTDGEQMVKCGRKVAE